MNCFVIMYIFTFRFSFRTKNDTKHIMLRLQLSYGLAIKYFPKPIYIGGLYFNIMSTLGNEEN